MDTRLWAILATFFVASMAGCLEDDATNDDDLVAADLPDLGDLVNATFLVNVIPAVHAGHGLYEPTIDVADNGAIYVSAHSTGIGVLPAPAFFSVDDGVTWENLPLMGPAALPAQFQGANPVLSDEIFIVAGDDGTAWGVDINLHDFILSGWCDRGAENCYYNPAAYDTSKVVTQAGECRGGIVGGKTVPGFPVPLKDRPWAAANNGKLFIVNNPGGGPAQIAAMDVPPAVPVEVGHVASGIEWNLCASSGGFIPGIPDMRDDHLFAVPQEDQGAYKVILGNAANVMDVREVHVFNNTHIAPAESDSTPSEIGLYGQASFDASGALFVGAMNNSNGMAAPDAGGIHMAVSTDDGETFVDTVFRFDQPVSSFYMDGNRYGEGMLLNWGQIDDAHTDWYFGHVFVGDDGVPYLTNVMLAVDDGPEASRHVQGAALGPDGRAYMVMSHVSGNDDQAMAAAAGTTPMEVVVQADGPVLATSMADEPESDDETA